VKANVAVFGAGPHGRELFEILWAQIGVRPALFDDALPDYDPCFMWDGPWVAGAAWPRVRQAIAERHGSRHEPFRLGRILFPTAYVSPSAHVGEHTHVGPNAVISHGCIVGSFVTVCAGVVLGGEVVVGDGVFIGANATIKHGGLTLGDGCIVGAGAVVTRSVAPNSTVAGNPARLLTSRRDTAWSR